MFFAEILFWVSIFFVCYTYVIYPLILGAIIVMKPDTRRDCPGAGDNFEALPPVSMIIAAYNEEKVIKEKLMNCMALNYPPDKLEVLIGSDGSTDRTDWIVEQVRMRWNIPINLRYVKFPRGGKTAVLNKLVPASHGEIIIFSDANSLYQPDSILHAVKHFSDPRIGCVCGELKLRAAGLKRPNPEQNYWNYEVMLKKMESHFGTVTGCNGGIYAIRKDLFQLLPENTLVDDFLISMRISLTGFDCIYEPQAIACEETAKNIRDEFQRRIRIGSGNIQNLIRLKDIFRFSRGKLAFCYLSHKVIRWMVPIFLVIIFTCNLVALHEKFYGDIFILQMIFYGFGLAGYAMERLGLKPGIFNIPYVFTSMNLALLLGFIRYCQGIHSATWERTER